MKCPELWGNLDSRQQEQIDGGDYKMTTNQLFSSKQFGDIAWWGY
ncbi:MAG: hypothetical protein AAF821_16235 [Cyanobacteria bacterium P01_D01_bin.156]